METYTIIEPKTYSNVEEKVEPEETIDLKVETILKDTEIILPLEIEKLYSPPTEEPYVSLNLEEAWDYEVTVKEDEVTYDKSPEVMDDEEATEAIDSMQVAQMTGDTQSMSYVDRARLARTALYDSQTVRIMHSINMKTNDVNFSQIY